VLGQTLTRQGQRAPGTNTIQSVWFAGDGWDSGWLTFYSFLAKLFPNEADPEDLRKLRLQERLSDAASSIYVFDFGIICTTRPRTKWTSTQLADRPVLHCADGPAVVFPDMELYFWRGTRVPREFIMAPETIDPSRALTEENTEQRRALCEILGWDKVLAHLQPRLIDEHPEPRFGQLLEADLPNAPNTRFLRAQCGTGKWITILVDPEAATAVEAGARSYNVSQELYKELKLRT
jgi:hypothetical protein